MPDSAKISEKSRKTNSTSVKIFVEIHPKGLICVKSKTLVIIKHRIYFIKHPSNYRAVNSKRGLIINKSKVFT